MSSGVVELIKKQQAEIEALEAKVERLELVLKLNRPDCPFYTTCTPDHRCPGCGGYDD